MAGSTWWTVLLVLLIGYCFVPGLDWGKVAPLGADFHFGRQIGPDPEQPLNPKWFQRPPLMTYLHHFLSSAPIKYFGGKIGLRNSQIRKVSLIWSRVLVSALFALSALFLYQVFLDYCKQTVAKLLTALFLTSAGLVLHIPYLTVDMPTQSFIAIGIYFLFRYAKTHRVKFYYLACALTGVATATKYNAAIFGISWFVLAFLICRKQRQPVVNVLMQWTFGIGLMILSFLILNPYSILDFKTFSIPFKHIQCGIILYMLNSLIQPTNVLHSISSIFNS